MIVIINFWGDSERVGGKRWNNFAHLLKKDNLKVLNLNYSKTIPARRNILLRRVLRMFGLHFFLYTEAYKECLKDLKSLEIESIDSIIVSFPPIEMFKALIDSDILNKNDKINLYVDVRDGILFETLEFPFELIIHKKSLKEMKETLFSRAKSIFFTNPYLLRLESSNYHSKSHVIFNGFIQLDRPHLPRTISNNMKFRLGYFGGLTKSTRGQNITNLLIDIDKCEARNHIELYFFGDFSAKEQALMGRYNFVKVFSTIPYKEAQIEMQNCDGLLLVATVTKRKSLLTGKIWDYLSQNKPIVYYGLKGMAFEILRDHNILISHDDLLKSLNNGQLDINDKFKLPYELTINEQYNKVRNLIS